MVSWTSNAGSPSAEIQVPNFQNQSYCKDLQVKDGQSYTMFIRSIDICNNTFVENRTVHIDRSIPHINNVWLVKDGYKVLFVHHVTDLSKMQLYFEALDPHSGIKQIEWVFGNDITELTSGSLRVESLNEKSCPLNAENCYCPDIGKCETFNYTVPLNKLISTNKHIGNHNRNYYFTIKVTNNAHLSNIEHADILVDASPPDVGVVFEGPINTKDIDYTSDSHFLIHWHGFIDHESGIREYRIGLASRCLSHEDLYDFSNITDIEFTTSVPHTELSVRIPAKFIGKRYISIIALNNAMDPSEAVCSDGIIRDLSPPSIRNFTIEHASWSETLVCHKGRAWLFHSSVTKRKLKNVPNCRELCKKHPFHHQLAASLPTIELGEKDSNESQLMCGSITLYQNTSIIYIPNNHIHLKWDIEEDRSQIDEVLVGIGTDPTELNSPSTNAYQETLKQNSFRYVHEGIGSDELFFVFLKVVNKASRKSIFVFGPILIDETPPICRTVPKVNIEKEDIVVGWENDTFYDIEQEEQISTIYFEIEHENTRVSPLLQWDVSSSLPCSGYSGGCFKYPIKRLQKQDNDLGLSFYIKMHVYNKAGHFITVSTEKFKIPSSYPPGHGIVLDSDPKDETYMSDTNVHFTPHTLCLRWYGFKHHELVKIQVGVGSDNLSDDVVHYMTLNHSENYHCIQSPKIEYQQKYYALVRAACTGGFTVSPSNGIVILNRRKLMKSLIVHIGEKCSTVNSVYFELINSSLAYSSVSFQGHIGKRYKIAIIQSSIGSIETDDGLIENDSSSNNSFYFVPFTENPIMNFTFNHVTVNQKLELLIHKCPNNKFLTERKWVIAHWFYNDRVSYGLTFQVAIMRMKNLTDDLSAVPFKQYELVLNRQSHKFLNINLEINKYYKFAVKQCTNVTCIDPVFSEVFRVSRSLKADRILESRLLNEADNFYTRINFKWSAFQSDNSILFYQWTVSADKTGYRILTEWKTIKTIGEPNKNEYQVSSLMHLPAHIYSTKFICVRAFDKAENENLICRQIESITSRNDTTPAVYDLEFNSKVWNKILQVLHSSNLGSLYTFLHDNELDFGTSETEVAGAILYAAERNITWFLMQSSRVPLKCDLSTECVFSKVTNTGFVSFESKLIKTNVIHYICAYTHSTLVIRELHTERLDEIKTCSNGFVLDSIAPVPGKVKINDVNENGFLSSLDNNEIFWEKFEENIDATKLGYPYNISAYSYGIATDHAGNTASAISEEVIVDTSPPLSGKIQISEMGLIQVTSLYLTTKMVTIYLSGFKDEESGIDHFEIGIGTQFFLTDILSARVLYEESIVLDMQDHDVKDGHTYYISAKAVNRAGLSSEYATLRAIADKSKPNGGHVLEGLNRNGVDMDYQSDLSEINVHWNGFSDKHSGINFYRAALGTKPFSENIQPFVNVGLLDYTTWHGEFSIGERYFTTIEACNHAGLCITRSSDGILLDSSPPTPGAVQIGSDEFHKKYQSHTSSVHVTWAGFEDPESGIDFYKMCIGTNPGQCDISERTNCLLQSNIIELGLTLPSQTPLFATVTAFNKLLLNVSKSSDSFFVDVTPPVAVLQPFFKVEKNNIHGKHGQWDRSVLHIEWRFVDYESPIIRHLVSLVTHHEGHTPIENIQIGAENSLTISLDGESWLHNGDSYFVIVTSCNLAELCTSDSSKDIIIDSTPPHVGGFKPPMVWENLNESEWQSNITLSWYGFHDQESGIERYFITISKTYSGNEITNGVATVNVNASESKIEHIFTFSATDGLKRDEKLFLTIWAENSVGLNSTMARVSVLVLSSSSTSEMSHLRGTLELEKHSCDINYCNNDCTCAVKGRPCVHVQSNATCHEVNTSLQDNEIPRVEVFNSLNEISPNITVSSACLSGSWKVRDDKNNNTGILRFEWTMGLHNEPFGEGIFDLRKEIPWNDVGLQSQAVHCLPMNKTLTAREKYVIYVRAWLSSDRYATFYSAPILIDHSPPSFVRGRTVMDSTELCNVDFDLIYWMDTITVCWDGVFSEHQGTIVNYFLALGTYPSGDDIIQRKSVGCISTMTFRNLSLSHGTKYFFTITAYNNVGLHSSASSDGFIIDMDEPISGVVYNTLKHRNAPYQSSTTTIGLSWHGFQDRVSGIRNYYVAISDTPYAKNELKFTNVGLRIQYLFRNLELMHGHKYYGFVKSTDHVGHESKVAVSNSIIIDSTRPNAYICQAYADIEHVSEDTIVYDKPVNLPFNSSSNTLYKIIGYMSLYEDNDAKVIFHLGDVHSLLPLMKYHNQTTFFEHTFFTITSGLQTILIESLNINQKYFSLNMTLYECTKDFENSHGAITAMQVSKSLVAVRLLVSDNESPIIKILLGAGTSPGGFQVKSLSRVHQLHNNHLLQTNVQHRSKVYVTAIVENKAGLRAVFNSKPVTIDHTKPDVKHLSVSLRSVQEIVSGIVITRAILNASWVTNDDESGIDICYCSIGRRPRLHDIISPWKAQTKTSCESNKFTASHGESVYLNLECFNSIGLSREDVTGPLAVSLQPPDSSNAVLMFIPHNEEDNGFISRAGFVPPVQSDNTSLLLKWGGFEDLSGILLYEYRIYQEGHAFLKQWEKTEKDMVNLENIELTDGEIIAEVRAVNTGSYVSNSVNASLFVASYPPKLTGLPANLTRQGEKLHLSWADVFDTVHYVPFSYSLTMGTRKGYADVLDMNYISNDNIIVSVPKSTILTPTVKEIFVSTVCIYETGLRATYTTVYKLE